MNLLSVMVKRFRFGNEVKSKLASVPLSSFLERLISVIKPAESQIMPVQLQRLVRLVSNQESRKGDGVKLFFHFSRASPSSLAVGSVVRMNGSNERNKTRSRR